MSKRFDLVLSVPVIDNLVSIPTALRVVSGTVKLEATYVTQAELDAGGVTDWEIVGGGNLVGPVTYNVVQKATALRYTAIGGAAQMYRIA